MSDRERVADELRRAYVKMLYPNIESVIPWENLLPDHRDAWLAVLDLAENLDLAEHRARRREEECRKSKSG